MPALAALAVVVVILFGTRWLLERRARDASGRTSVFSQVVMLVLTVAGFLAVVIVLPLDASTRAELLGLLGLLLSAAIALSSTTFIGNAMAGLMLRAIRNFRPGDFLRVGELFGRVSEHGLLHTEIQTEDRDLTTIPNLHLVTNPVTVVRASGTVLSAAVSIGYDVSRVRVEAALLQAARSAELKDAFVQILELGDYSVVYRVAGILEEVRFLLTSRSKLRAAMLDTLHSAGIEIVSPGFMNQRVLPSDTRITPGQLSPRSHGASAPDVPPPEARIFDKAARAEAESLEGELDTLVKRIEELERQIERAEPDNRAELEAELEEARARRVQIGATLGASQGDGEPSAP